MGKISIYDPKSGEEAFVSEAAFEELNEMNVITETGAFADDEWIAELGLSPWTLVRAALQEDKNG